MRHTLYRMNSAWVAYRALQRRGDWKASDSAFERYKDLRDSYVDEGGLL